MINLKSLAEHLGVSQATVSRALNDYSSVNAETKARVLAAAQELGYRPNSNARRLATGRIGAVGMVMPSGDSLLTDPHFVDFLAGLTETLATWENEVVLTASSEISTYQRFATSGKVDAFVISSPLPQDERISVLCEIGFPFVVHGRGEMDPTYPYYDIDNREAARRGAGFLLELGHRDIGFVNGPAGAMFAVYREEGLRIALENQGLVYRPDRVLNGAMTEEDGYRLAGRLLEAETPPTAILCSSTLMVLGVLRQIRERGLVVGRDISVITHDDGLSSLKTNNFSVPLTVTYSSIREAGEAIAGMARKLVDGVPERDLQVVAPTELIVRGSTGPVPG
ncbi:MAG: substrate-binding domain-containing protein [Pseudomonadota bacterium]